MSSHHNQQKGAQAARSPLSGSTSQQQYQLEGVWPLPSESVQEDVVKFWLTELPSSELAATQERALQLLVVARDSDGKIAGVSTALRMYVEHLGFDCFFYRTFVGQAQRVQGLRSTGLGWKILYESYRLLNERFQQGNDLSVLGLYAEMENASIMRCRNEAVWQEDGMNFVYVGKTQSGRHVRVWYFDDARVP